MDSTYLTDGSGHPIKCQRCKTPIIENSGEIEVTSAMKKHLEEKGFTVSGSVRNRWLCGDCGDTTTEEMEENFYKKNSPFDREYE